MPPKIQENTQENFSVEFPTLQLNLFSNALDDRYDMVDLHWHGRLEVIHVIDGQGVIAIDFTELQVCKGDIIIVPPKALHNARGRDGQLLVSQTAVFNLECFRHNACYHNLIRPGMAGYEDILRMLELIFAPRCGSLSSQELLLRGYVTSLYALLGCYGYEKQGEKERNDSNQAIKSVISYIHEHYHERISVVTLSSIAGYSKYHFVRYFSSHMGCNCSFYIQAIRLSKAKEFLRTTGMNISDISEQCGFDSVSYFIKVFRNHTGMTPLKYRQFNAGNQLEKTE